MMLYRNTKVKLRSPDRDRDYFDIVAGVLQGNTLALYLFIICLDYVLRKSIDKMKDNGFKLAKERSRRYSTQTITGADCADDIALLANTPAQAETLQHRLERTVAGIGLHDNTDKTKYMCFNQRGDIFALNGSSLKLVDKFTYLGSSVPSNKPDINTWLAKAWRAIDWQSVIWKLDLTDKMKCSFFFKQQSCRYRYIDARHGRLVNIWRKSLTVTTQECCEQYWTSPGSNTPQNSSYTATYLPSQKISKLDEPDIRDIAGEVGTNS